MDDDLDVTWKAIHNAYDKFIDTLEDEGVDATYWILNLKVNLLSTDFKYILETIKYNNKEIKLK